VLMSGNHADITRWRLKQSLGRTQQRRPDLLAERERQRTLSAEERVLLEAFRNEAQGAAK
jgi:tRNA (guanine37-N1)-methyltransferase